MSFRFLSPALEEMTQAAGYYGRVTAGLGAEFIEEVDAAIRRIVRFPEAWGRISEDYRHCNLQRFPYTLIYKRMDDGGILIISVFHQSRQPSSWKENL